MSPDPSEKDNEIDFYISEVQESEERSQIAEHENRNLIQRIRQLTSALEKSVPIAELNNPRPLDWSEFLDWVDQVYPDKISLTSAARRMTKAPMFEDVGLVTRCIAWLATVQHETRIGGGGSLRDVSIENGIINSPCGGDEYSVNWQGRRLRVDWHVKNGGNVRDPSRCLRIYYFWEPDMQMTVIDHLPAHRKTSAT